MTVAGAVLSFLFISLSSAVLYSRIAKLRSKQKSGTDDYSRLFDELPIPMYIYDHLTFRFLAVNAAAVDQYGYSREELLRLKVTDIRPPEEIPAFLKFHETILKNRLDAGRWLHRNKEGRTFEVQVFTHDTRFEGRAARQALVFNLDEKTRAETILREKSAELENMLDSITDGFYALNSNWEVTFINKAAERALCCSKEEVMGKNLWEFFPRSREGRFYAEYERAMTERISVHFEELYAPLGVWGSMNVYPTKDGIAVYFVDITEQKKIQEKIYNDGQNLRAIINNTRDLIWSVDRQSHIITGNQAFRDRVQELTGKSETEVTHADFVQERLKVFFESYERAFKGEAFSIVRQREIDGRQVYEELSFNPIRDLHDEVIGVTCFLRDITESQEHLHKIEKQNERLREIAWIQSHRVRAPLANILGLTQLIDLTDSTDAEIIPKIKKAAEELDKVILDITALTDDLIDPGTA
ncbi:PAS domain S-box protein [Mucilaginibacter sp. BJC16-A38]|uniref:PAS domain S-box protein n=1 Tax=Mucilaginibacter phenanthrenivorans TaxID=1234842 RepID=UPI0021582F97|nr:PAS domain S-box protein [Mucilaginibacter phenanthrenivorans]MCR8561584.1 PAS domain S-box protein [Mucilaginibacter phenanthrenivorans]